MTAFLHGEHIFALGEKNRGERRETKRRERRDTTRGEV